MRQVTLTFPQLGLIGGTRALLGAGIALLAADWMSQQERRAVGWTLLAVGVVTTLPLAAQVFSQAKAPVATDGRITNRRMPHRRAEIEPVASP
jgi:hypothetical protein